MYSSLTPGNSTRKQHQEVYISKNSPIGFKSNFNLWYLQKESTPSQLMFKINTRRMNRRSNNFFLHLTTNFLSLNHANSCLKVGS